MGEGELPLTTNCVPNAMLKLGHTDEQLTRRTGLILINRFGEQFSLPVIAWNQIRRSNYGVGSLL